MQALGFADCVGDEVDRQGFAHVESRRALNGPSSAFLIETDGDFPSSPGLGPTEPIVLLALALAPHGQTMVSRATGHDRLKREVELDARGHRSRTCRTQNDRNS